MQVRSVFPILMLLGALLYAVVKLSVPPPEGTFDARGIASVSATKTFKTLQLNRIQKADSPFDGRKVVLRKKLRAIPSSNTGAQKAAVGEQLVVPANTELAALIDNNCLKKSYRAQLSKSLTSSLNSSNLKHQVYSMVIRNETRLSDLESQVQGDECIVGVAENGEVDMDSFFSDPSVDEQNHLQNIKSKTSEDFFYNSSLTLNENIVVAVVDSGIDYEHPDLSTQMWVNNQGHFGHDFVNDDSSPMDDNEHGTHVAGLIAAAGGNDEGVAGVMPSGVRLMAVKVLDENGSGTFKDVANGIRYAVENNADLINVSLSGSSLNALVEDALIFALNNGIPVIVSAGNDDIEIGDEWDELKFEGNARTPSSMGKDLDGVIAVGAIDAVTSDKSPFSNYSTEYVEIAAPGSNGILSTLPNEAYGNMNGTSMSAPVVSGAVALIIRTLKANDYPFTPAEVEDILINGSPERNSLKPFFKNGKHLDLEVLRNQLRHQVITPVSAGVDDAF